MQSSYSHDKLESVFARSARSSWAIRGYYRKAASSNIDRSLKGSLWVGCVESVEFAT